MADSYRLGSKAELPARALFSVKIERHRIAVFLYEGRLTAMTAGSTANSSRAGVQRDHGEKARRVMTKSRCRCTRSKGGVEKPMERAGRKANRLGEVEQPTV
jgi:hypothetical protein